MEMDKLIETATQYGIDYGLNIILAIVTYIIGKSVAKLLKNTLIKFMKRSNTDALLITFSSNLAYSARHSRI